jgi:long-chain acyl-CoA synthetase
MLLDRWQSIVRDRPHHRALTDLPSRRSWTFAELDHLARHLPAAPRHAILHPQGSGPEFILQVLRGWHSAAALCPLESGQPAPQLPPPTPPVVHLKTTSATTGNARAVGFTASQLAADAANLIHAMGLRTDWPNLAAISLAHSYGFSNLVLPLLLHGIPLVLVGSSLPDAIRQALEACGPVTLPSVPALWRVWSDAGVLRPSIQLAISAGAPLPLELEHHVHAQLGLKIHNFYGATECGGIAYDDSTDPRSDATLIGRPPPHVQLQLDDLGCLMVSGPAVGSGYWPDSSPTLTPGTFRTSDLAQLHPDGRVYLQGTRG